MTDANYSNSKSQKFPYSEDIVLFQHIMFICNCG